MKTQKKKQRLKYERQVKQYWNILLKNKSMAELFRMIAKRNSK